MGAEDDTNASIAHLVLCCVAGSGFNRISERSYVQPGMHANFFCYGIVGFLHYQSGLFNTDFKTAYMIGTKATRYLAIPFLMGDLYRAERERSAIHLISGLVPFAMAVTGKDNVPLGNMLLFINIISLAHYSFQHERQWGWFTAIGALFAYFGTAEQKVIYPLSLALMEYCAYRLYHVTLDVPPPPRR